jgi:hypothetical protein
LDVGAAEGTWLGCTSLANNSANDTVGAFVGGKVGGCVVGGPVGAIVGAIVARGMVGTVVEPGSKSTT